MQHISDVYFWLSARLAIGFIFLWAFFDKLFGLGFATKSAQSWLNGGSPTTGFLKFGVTGPLAGFFNSLSGSVLVDWLFMLGLLGVGLGLVLGVAVRLASFFGSVMLFLMWLALLWPKNNPFLDDHLVYLIVLVGLYTSTVRSEDVFGLGKWWKSLPLVSKFPFLQ